MLRETCAYIMDRQKHNPDFTYEIIIVNDGSKDRTPMIAEQYTQRFGSDIVRLLDLKVNQGKGGAVQQGMLHARGRKLLMVDGDAATRISDLENLESSLDRITNSAGHGIAVGSRAHLAEKAASKRKWYRNILMHGFHFAVSCIGGIWHVKDTQCGFKLFTRETARVVFSNQHLRRWCFDVELLHVSQRVGNIPVAEVGVEWHEVPGSKLSIIESSFSMARDLLVIRIAYAFGIWRVQDGREMLETAQKKAA
jgi:dolichyl-phosphate beta-glucosyltransferase